jgi:phosphoribosyl 1,2-cyclic phosphate phosphodiesterase
LERTAIQVFPISVTNDLQSSPLQGKRYGGDSHSRATLQTAYFGFRIKNFAYLTDVKQLPDEELPKLEGLDILVVSALREERHLSHQTLAEAISLAKAIGAQKTYFTHMSHQIGLHQVISRKLPPSFAFAYDGLELIL